MWVCVVEWVSLSGAWLWKNLAAWCQFARDILFLSPPSLFLPVSMLSACQAQLRGLEGSVPALQSHLLWQYLASLFLHTHQHTDTQKPRWSYMRIGNREKPRMRWNEVSDGLEWDMQWKWGWKMMDHSIWHVSAWLHQREGTCVNTHFAKAPRFTVFNDGHLSFNIHLESPVNHNFRWIIIII